MKSAIEFRPQRLINSFLVLSFLIGALCPALCAADDPPAPSTFAEKYALAEEYWAQKRYDQAKALYEDIAVNSTDSEWVVKGLGGIACCDIYLGNDSAVRQAIETLFNQYSSAEEFMKNIYFISYYYGQAGQHAASQALYDRLLTAFPNDPFIPRMLADEIRYSLNTGDMQRADQKTEELFEYYQSADSFLTAANRVIIYYDRINDSGKVMDLSSRALALYPNHDKSMPIYAGLAKIKAGMYSAVDNVEGDMVDPDALTVDAIVDTLVADYNDLPGVDLHLLQIGEQYYFRANELRAEKNQEAAQDCCRKSLAVCQRALENTADSGFHDSLHYVSGLNHWNFQNWYETAESFFQTLDHDPNFIYAGPLHGLISTCYQRLVDVAVFTEEEAAPTIGG